MPEPRVAVFDLDGTLCRGDSFAGFLRRSMLRGRFRAVVSLAAAVVLVPLFLLPAGRRRAVRGFVLLATAGRSTAQLAAMAAEFAASHVARGRIEPVLARLREHRERGDRVVVATGCAEPLASAVCRELGLDGVELLAAELAPGRFAHRPVRGCLGTQKVARLGESGIAVPVDHAYTDSSMDLPLLRAAEHRYLVEPRPRTVARVRAALGAGFTVLD
ncbi:HAD family hydrolase [Kitasatospora saccharophila]|uniref:HAD family hydrolase n=1 Tax=Kitasatospora saccharophila TaxID=407973 RepID=A0ABN2WS35_9ACTN